MIYKIDNKIIINMMKDLNDNCYYLGGQIKMTFDDHIGFDLIDKVRDIERKRLTEYGGPCNGWEYMSINEHKRKLNETENILKKYFEIIELREKLN
jgi:hypothetical protein